MRGAGVRVWYPYPYSELASGRELFALVVSVDVVIGPLLSLVVYNPKKPRRELWRDIGTVFVLQLAALGYGLHSVTQARPVWLAFEGDQFRVVAVPDIDTASLAQAPGGMAQLSWTGPKTIGVKLLDGGGPEYLRSIQLAMEGIHPAFRPQRWVDYDSQRSEVIKRSKPLSELKRKRPEQSPLIDEAVRKSGFAETDLGYLPLVGRATYRLDRCGQFEGRHSQAVPADRRLVASTPLRFISVSSGSRDLQRQEWHTG